MARIATQAINGFGRISDDTAGSNRADSGVQAKPVHLQPRLDGALVEDVLAVAFLAALVFVAALTATGWAELAFAAAALVVDGLPADVLVLVAVVFAVDVFPLPRRGADFFSGASRIRASHSAKVRLAGSRSLGKRAFFWPLVM